MLRTQYNKSSVLTFTLVCLLGWTPEVHAYLDPGTGSMVLQLFISIVLGFIFTLRIYWEKFKKFFKKVFSKNNSDNYTGW